MKTTTTRIAVAVALMLALSGCAGAAGTPVAPSDTPAAGTLSVTDAWVKAADTGMSGAFGTLENSGATDLTVVSAESSASSMLELHETVTNDAGEMVMQEKNDGFVVPADGEVELAPGANHIMLMGLTDPLRAGDEVTITLTLSDGSTLDFTAPVKDYTGANESYEGDAEMDMDTENQ